MMNNILIVARREVGQILKLKSFWLTLLLLPVAIAVGPLITDVLDEDEATRVAVIDRSGGTAKQALEARIGFDGSQYVLRELARYVQRYNLQDADPDAPWAQADKWFTPQDVAQFESQGGLDGALEKIARVLPDGMPEFEAPNPDYSTVEAPETLTKAQGDAFGDTARSLFEDDPDNTNPEVIVLIPETYPAQPDIQLYSANRPRSDLVMIVQEVLTADLRTNLLADSGVTGERAAVVQSAAPNISVDTPPPGSGVRETLLVQSIVPVALAYILMMSLMLSGSWMLQGSVEERSNKLLESLLACISPEELMYGKLLGGLAVGLMMITVWFGCAGVVAYATQGAISDLIRPALEPISSPGIIAAIIFFFIAGYIGISAIFVAIGAMVDSMSEAQGYMMPVLFLILLPITFLLQAIVMGNDGFMVHLLTWVPLWTPFAVLARLGLGIAAWELIGAGIVLAIAIALELMLIARLFRANLLSKGQKTGMARLMQFMRPSSKTT